MVYPFWLQGVHEKKYFPSSLGCGIHPGLSNRTLWRKEIYIPFIWKTIADRMQGHPIRVWIDCNIWRYWSRHGVCIKQEVSKYLLLNQLSKEIKRYQQELVNKNLIIFTRDRTIRTLEIQNKALSEELEKQKWNSNYYQKLSNIRLQQLEEHRKINKTIINN